MNPPTLKWIQEDLAELLHDFNGHEYSGDIGPATLFFGDLGMVSIDAVILAETLEQRYGQPFPFSKFLSDLGRQTRNDLAVGELAAFLHQSWGQHGGKE
jgi:acyl carrier protein